MTAIPQWLDQPVWRPVTCPFTVGSAMRAPALLEKVLALHDVEHAPRYAPEWIVIDGERKLLTRCNLYVGDITRALACPIPLQWLKGARWDEQDANEMVAWLRTEGIRNHGWRNSTPLAAQARANLGFPAVACWVNPGGTGHVAMFRPDTGRQGLFIAQAGASNFTDGTLSQGFGQRDVECFTHD